MSEISKIALERAEKIAEAVVKRLAPYCKKKADGNAYIEVAGSVRRRRPWVNDLDFVLIPSDPWRLHNAIMELAQGEAKASGARIMRVMCGEVQLDIYFATPETWATLLLIRTGSKENNIRLCSLAKKRGWHLAANGDGLFDENGTRVAGDTEKSIYQALAVPYQEPGER